MISISSASVPVNATGGGCTRRLLWRLPRPEEADVVLDLRPELRGEEAADSKAIEGLGDGAMGLGDMGVGSSSG